MQDAGGCQAGSWKLEAWIDMSITATLAKVEAKYGICEGRSVNGPRGDLDSHEPFFDIKGLAVLRGFLCRGDFQHLYI